MTEETLIEKTKRLFRCDAVRLCRFPGAIFALLGWHRTSDGEWFDQDGAPRTFDYLEEKTVAHGDDLESLWVDIRRYRRLCLLDKIKDPIKRLEKMLEIIP